MPFDPVSVVGYFSTAMGLLSFIVSSIENVDKRVHEYTYCKAHWLHYYNSVQTSIQLYRGWTRIWCDGDRPYLEDTYKYFWDKEGFTNVCRRVDVIKSCFAEVDDLISNGSGAIIYDSNAPKPSTTDWEIWRLMMSRIKRSGPDFRMETNFGYRICFALYKSPALKTAIDRLKDAIDDLYAYSASAFWNLQDEPNLRKDIDVAMLERLNALNTRVKEWSKFMCELYHIRIETLWTLVLRAPDVQGSPMCLETDSDIEINFVNEKEILSGYYSARVVVIRYPEDLSICSCLEQGVQATSLSRSELEPVMKGVAFRFVLNKISESTLEHQKILRLTTRLERAEAAVGLVNWVILLWNTPWVAEVCTCSIHSAFYTDKMCHFTLGWTEECHVGPQCIALNYKERKYLHLGVALAEFAVGAPLTMIEEPQRTFRLGSKPMSPLDLLRDVQRHTSFQYRTAVEYCFKMDCKTTLGAFRPENLERNTNSILKPVQQYFDDLKEHQQTQENRQWLKSILMTEQPFRRQARTLKSNVQNMEIE
jgi:hypothetical protein